MTQCEQVLFHLQQGYTLTTFESFERFRITRLPDRVRDLRAKGHTIYAEMITVPSGKRVAQYSL